MLCGEGRHDTSAAAMEPSRTEPRNHLQREPDQKRGSLLDAGGKPVADHETDQDARTSDVDGTPHSRDVVVHRSFRATTPAGQTHRAHLAAEE